MIPRQKDRVYARWIGPADRQYGEFRGEPVELLTGCSSARAYVRFPDGAQSWAHWDHLTDVLFRLGES